MQTYQITAQHNPLALAKCLQGYLKFLGWLAFSTLIPVNIPDESFFVTRSAKLTMYMGT